MTKRGRYLVGQKLSDARIERILLAYAEGLTAAEFIRHAKATMRKPPAEKTVYQIYRLVRKRLYDVGLHHSEYWLENAHKWPADEGLDFFKEVYARSGLERHIRAEIARKRGLTKQNRDHMICEVVTRIFFPHPTPQAYLATIHKVIKICGKLNEPVRDITVWNLHRRLMRELDWIRETRSLDAELSLGPREGAIFDAPMLLSTEREIRREKRRLAKERTKPRQPPPTLEESRRRITLLIASRTMPSSRNSKVGTAQRPYSVRTFDS